MNELIERLRRMFVVITITRLWTNTPIEATRFFSSYIRFLVSSVRTSSLWEAGVGRRWDVTAELLVALVAAVSKEDGYHGVDEEQLERRGREPFLLFFARMTEGVVRLPIRCDGATEQFACRLHVVAIEQLAQSGPSLIEQIGQLSDANMWKILRTESQKLPKLEVDRLKRKLVL